MMDFALQHNEFKILDLDTSSSDLSICATDADTIAQTIAVRLKTLAGEWFLDTSIGVPYFTEIFGHKRNIRFIRQMILPEIEAVPDVREVKDFNAQEKPDRKLIITFTAVLSNGTHIKFNEPVGV